MKCNELPKSKLLRNLGCNEQHIINSVVDFFKKLGFSERDIFNIDINCISHEKRRLCTVGREQCIVIYPVENVNIFIPCTVENINSVVNFVFEDNKIYDLKFVLFCVVASMTISYNISYKEHKVIKPRLSTRKKLRNEDPLHPLEESFLYGVSCFVATEANELSLSLHPYITYTESAESRSKRLDSDIQRLLLLGDKIKEIMMSYDKKKIFFKDVVNKKRYMKSIDQVGDLIDNIFIEY